DRKSTRLNSSHVSTSYAVFCLKKKCLPLVFSRHPVTGKRNVGMYRMQRYDSCTTGMHWQLHKVGAEHYRLAEGLKRRIPIAVALGGDPVLTYAATAPLPPEIDEMLFAGWLRRKP